MHPSYFRILKCMENDPKASLALSAEASEWLFSIKFWDAINAELKSNFGQYEDDTLSSDDAVSVLQAIGRIQHDYLGDPEYSPNVVYGWTPEGEKLEFSVSNEELNKSIEDLKSLIRNAVEMESNVFCQL